MSDSPNHPNKTVDDPDAIADFNRNRPSIVERIQHALHVTPSLVPLIVLTLAITIFGLLLGSKFFSPFTLTLILQQVAIVGIVGAAQSMVILTAGIDLSVGAITVLSSVVMGQFTFRYGLPVGVSIFCGLIAGTMVGFLNGWLVAKVKLPPFIVTLGMWQIALATNFLYSANATIRAQDIDKQAPLLHFFGEKIKLGGAVFTYGVIFMVLLVILLMHLMTLWL